MPVERVSGFSQLQTSDLQPPSWPHVFFDPPDTETLAWAAADVIVPGCGVLDLGAGSGAATASFVRSGAGHAHGVDVSQESVRWADEHYGSGAHEPGVTFATCDFLNESTTVLLESWPEAFLPSVVASNPPYVPTTETTPESHPSMDGGPDGLRFLSAILNHALTLEADLALVIGSFSSPLQAVSALQDAGYRIHTVTLATALFGEFSLNNKERILEMEQLGKAVIWRSNVHSTLGYVVVGLAATLGKRHPSAGPAFEPHDLLSLLTAACSSKQHRLELLSDAPANNKVLVRVLELPELEGV